MNRNIAIISSLLFLSFPPLTLANPPHSLSQKITPNNFNELKSALLEKDINKDGFVGNDDFVRCLSRSQMKCTEREVY